MSPTVSVYIAQYIIYINENFSAVTLVDGSLQEDDTRMSYLLIEKQQAAGPYSVSIHIRRERETLIPLQLALQRGRG